MFGYTVPIESILSSDERRIYRSYYCETCHHLREEYGIISTLAVNYEMTFMNLFFNSIFEEGSLIDNKPGGLFCIFRHSASNHELMHKITAYTILVAKNGLYDDVLDNKNDIKGKLGLLGLNRAIKKAVNEFPEYDDIVMKGYDELRKMENNGENDPLMMGKYSSQSMIDVLKIMLHNDLDDDIIQFFRGLGTWVYVMDAVEDLDEDYRKGTYNPFLVGCNDFVSKRKFVSDNVFLIGETIGKAISEIKKQYSKLYPRLRYNQNIIDNIINYGIPYSAQRIINGERMDLSCRNIINGRLTRGEPVSL